MNLTSQEKLSLCGLVRYPESSLSELAEILNINYWTLYKIKEKFKRENIIREVVIPNYASLGFELLIAGYGSLTKKRIGDLDKMQRKISDIKNKFASGIFYAFVESYKGFVLGISKNYTEIVKSIIYAERMMNIRDLILRENTNIVLLPFELTEIPILFDYSSLLCKEFDISLPPSPKNSKKCEKLNLTELKVLYEIVKNPDISMVEISKKLKISRQRASKINRKLMEEGWYVKRVIPDLKKLGYEVLVFAHWNSNPEVVNKMNKEFRTLGIDISNIVFLAYNSVEGVALAPFKSLRESREIIAIFTKFMEETQILIEEPHMIFLSLDEGVEVRNHDYSSTLLPLITNFL